MSRYQIFLSHSAHTDPDREVRDAVAKALETQFDVFVDHKSLRTGLPWRPGIEAAIDCSDGAVVLLSDTAVNQMATYPWVHYETTLLMNRRRFVLQFPVFCVRMPNVTVNDLSQGPWNAINVLSLQFEPFTDGNAAVLGQRLVAALTASMPSRPNLDRQRVFRRVMNRLATVKRSGTLVEAAEAMSVADCNVWREDVCAAKLADALLGVDPTVFVKGFDLLTDPLRADAKEVLDCVAAYWLRQKDWAPLADLIVRLQSPKPVAVVQGDRRLAGELAGVRGASMANRPVTVVVLEGAQSGGNTVSHFEEQLIGIARQKKSVESRDDAIEYLRDAKRAAGIVVVVFHQDDSAGLVELVKTYDALTFLILCGKADPHSTPYPHKVVLEPWSLADEEALREHYRDAEQLIV